MTESVHKKIEPIDASEIADRVIEVVRARWIGLMTWSIVLVYSTVAVQEVSNSLFRANKIALFGIVYALGFAALTAATIAFVRMSFAAVDDKAITVQEAIAGSAPVFVWYIATSSLFSALMLLGLFLLLVPGVIIMLAFGFAPLLVIDEKLTPMLAYKRSAQLTKGTRLRVLYIYSAAFALAFMAMAPWMLAPGVFGTGMLYAVSTFIFCVFSVLSAVVTRALQVRQKEVLKQCLTGDSLSV